MTTSDPLTAPPFFNFATDVVDRWAQDPTKTALVWTDTEGTRTERFSFADIAARSRALAGGLQRAGLEPGDRVAVLVGRRPAWWIALTALVRAGLVAVPGTTQLTERDIKYRLEHARVRGVICESALAARVDAVRAQCPGVLTYLVADGRRPGWECLDDWLANPPGFPPIRTRSDEPCLVYFTSGTTGSPKKVVHTHASYPLGHLLTGRDWLNLGPDDLHWNLSDTGWAKAAWSSLFGPWNLGAAVFVQEAAGKFDPVATIATLRSHPITTFCAPPTVYRQLVTLDFGPAPLGKLRHAVAAGEPLNPEVIHAWQRATGLVIRDGYGQTETTLLVGNFPGRLVKPGSMGTASPAFDVQILNDDLSPAPPGVEGEVAIRVRPNRPLGLFLHYEDNPQENAQKFRGDYYLTGDRASRDEDGYFWFVGRGDDVILSAGYRIGPFEVESALIEHPAVQEAAVIGMPDPARYEIVKAFVLLVPGHQASPELARELQEHVKRVTAPYKYPRAIEFVDSLPKTISGKIRRVELRQREARRRATGLAPGTD